ncbi:hypothetical protein [Streptomyces sp. sk2.1]|uniref:hypothetical protein n=1 Tax=Streptomyces sp. sk2.1 TaxID=2478959 RepID=UPI0011E6F48E|nr:hypothetical protein [Streptomyces sp. sk2.1]TXS61184.1 hypothetical protein EAO76_41665 [Streptomyces sp. sk2.1]
MLITAAHFPASPLALRTTDPVKQARIRAFAAEQAAIANTVRDRLTAALATAQSHASRLAVMRAAHQQVTEWRYQAALRASSRLGTGIAYSAERFRTPITAATLNYDRIGRVGRLRDGATWDEETRTYQGGAATPAYDAMVAYGQAATDRFTTENITGDVLQNWVDLPAGRRVAGNRILRGEAARRIGAELADRVAARGLDASRMETGGNPVYTATPTLTDSDQLFTAAMETLAAPSLTLETFATARYLLFQAPRCKKGSDAVTRTFTVAVGAALLGTDAPDLPADIDLRCYVLGQETASRIAISAWG